MTKITRLADGSLTPTTRFDAIVAQTYSPTSSAPRCQVYSFEDYVKPPPGAPPGYTAIDDLLTEWEREPEDRAGLEEARRWVADAFYGEDGATVRTLRLRKGWSQARLAEALATSQSHVARIERGTENLTIETCRKLTRALGIDLNTLDRALKHQEDIVRARRG